MQNSTVGLNYEQEEINQRHTIQTCAYSIYYNCVKDCFLKNTWRKIRNKHLHVFMEYQNGTKVSDAFNNIYNKIKNK